MGNKNNDMKTPNIDSNLSYYQNIWYKRCNAVKNSIKKSYYDCEAKRNLIASSFKQLNDRCRDSMFLQWHI